MVNISDPAYSEMTGISLNLDVLNTIVNLSKGQEMMSAEDTKQAMLYLMMMFGQQLKLNDQLIKRVAELEDKIVRNR